jgi:tripartite ATP-independent transporter DctM subunit
LFIIAGGLINRAHIGDHLVNLIELFVGRIKGGLGAVTVVACAVFGAITGSSSATLTAIGTIVFPRLEKAGYPLGHSAALMASSAVLGILVPPSALMILYAWVGGQSVLAAFLACVVPAVLLTVLLCAVNMWLLRSNRNLVVPEKLPRGAFVKEVSRRGFVATPALAMPFLILGSIYGGILTPTEAAALSVIYAVPVGFLIYRKLTIKGAVEVLLEAAATTGIIMVMLFAVMMLSRLYIMEDVPSQIMAALTTVSDNPVIILIMINLFMVIIGMLMDDVSAVLLATPTLLPLVVQLHVDPIQFAAIVGVNLGMGNITPPTAPLLYLSGQLNGARINQTMHPTLCMIGFAWLPTLVLTTYVPEISLWLPHLVFGT